MFGKFIQNIHQRRLLQALLKHLPGIILLIGCIRVPFANAKPTDLVLQNTTVTTARTFTDTNSITAGPDFTVTATGYANRNARTWP